MATGRVIQFNETRGYGFIAPDGGGDDVFVHAEQVKACGGPVTVGARVNFEVIEGQRGHKAYGVQLIDADGLPATATAIVGTTIIPGGAAPADALTASEYAQELTDLLMAHCPGATAAQIVTVRQRLVATARRRGWVGDGQP